MEYHVYSLLKSSCFKLLGNRKYGLLLIQKVNGKIKFTWNVLAFHFLDIPEPRKYDFGAVYLLCKWHNLLRKLEQD